ncbi:hypothetical protein [Cereibacter johrii]
MAAVDAISKFDPAKAPYAAVASVLMRGACYEHVTENAPMYVPQS